MRLLLISLLWLVVSTTHARLGETEQQIVLQHPAALNVERNQMGTATLLTIEDLYTSYTAGFLDGKCEVEVYRNLDDSKLKESFIVGELKAYGKHWLPLDCVVHDCLAAMAEDQQHIAKLGYSRTLDKYNTFTVFTRKWYNFSHKILEKALKDKEKI